MDFKKIADRMTFVRVNSKLSQTDFARSLGLTKSAISGYETGRRVPTESVLRLIARTFQVEEAWLRDGTGPMYEESQKDTLSDMMQTYGLPEAFRGLLAAYRALPSDREREIVCRYIERAAAEIRDGQPPAGEGTDDAEESEDLEAWAEEQARRYKRQLLQERRKGSSASSQSVSGEAGAGTDVDSA